jgi:hypothetical protein
MKIKTIFLFVCVSTTCFAVQLGIYKGIVRGAIDPCPQTTTKAGTPCPFTGQLINDCFGSVDCNEYVSYSAYAKNTGYQNNKPAETYTTVDENTAAYECADWTKCVRNVITGICESQEGVSGTNENLYTAHSCNNN